MIIPAAIVLWIMALLAHALLQPKICRILSLPALPQLPLHLCRLALPLVVLFLCCKTGILYGVLIWIGTSSIGGVLACLTLTFISLRQMGDRKFRKQPTSLL